MTSVDRGLRANADVAVGFSYRNANELFSATFSDTALRPKPFTDESFVTRSQHLRLNLEVLSPHLSLSLFELELLRRSISEATAGISFIDICDMLTLDSFGDS